MIEMGALSLFSPGWLSLALVPLALGLLRRRRDQRILGYADPPLRAWVIREGGAGRSRWRGISMVVGWLLLALALADPRLPASAVDQSADAGRHPLPVMVVLDVSPAMSADDITPTRAERARRLLEDLYPTLNGERLGLVLYSGEAGLVVPPTRDYPLLSHYAELGPTALARWPGTRLDQALRIAAESTEMAGGVVLYLGSADARGFQGDAGTSLLAATRLLAEKGIGLFALVLASEQGGQARDEFGVPVADIRGETWLSSPSLGGVDELTRLTGGQWRLVSNNRDDVAAIQTFLANWPLPPQVRDALRQQSQPLFAWLLLPALLAFLLALSPTGLWWRGWRHTAAPAALLPGLLLAALALPEPLRAENDPARQWQAWQAGDYANAQLDYAAQRGFAGRFGEGAAAYKRGDHAHAQRQFQQALLLAPDQDARADALFNLGNALFQQGRYAAAQEAYRDVLALRPDDSAASRNHYLASQRLAALRERVQDEEPPGQRPTDFARYQEVDDEMTFPDGEATDVAGGVGAEAGAVVGDERTDGERTPYVMDEAAYHSILDAAQTKLDLVDDRPEGLLGQLIRQQARGRGEVEP